MGKDDGNVISMEMTAETGALDYMTTWEKIERKRSQGPSFEGNHREPLMWLIQCYFWFSLGENWL